MRLWIISLLVLLGAVNKGKRFSRKKSFFVVGTKTSFGKMFQKDTKGLLCCFGKKCFDTSKTAWQNVYIIKDTYRCFINNHEDSQGCRNDLSMRQLIALCWQNLVVQMGLLWSACACLGRMGYIEEEEAKVNEAVYFVQVVSWYAVSSNRCSRRPIKDLKWGQKSNIDTLSPSRIQVWHLFL